MLHDSHFPSEPVEARGRFVSKSVGHFMTFRILTDDIKKIVCQSSVRSAIKAGTCNHRLENLDLPNIFQVQDPENAVIYEQPNPGPEDGGDFLISFDTEFAFVHFLKGTKLTKFVNKEPLTGIVLCYNEDVTTYTIMFPEEQIDHNEVQQLYNPIIARKDPTAINEEIVGLAGFDVPNPIEKLDNMEGKSFLMDIQEDGFCQRTTIVQLIEGVE